MVKSSVTSIWLRSAEPTAVMSLHFMFSALRSKVVWLICWGVRVRALSFSKLWTRGSLRSLGWSCPWPTSIAVTEDAPFWRRQSVKPPVEAPTSRAVLLETLMLKWERKAFSFSPARLTKGGVEAIWRVVSEGRVLLGLWMGWLLRETRPERMRFLAWERVSHIFCWTRSSSARRLGGMVIF